jgi:hypothetical protein
MLMLQTVEQDLEYLKVKVDNKHNTIITNMLYN